MNNPELPPLPLRYGIVDKPMYDDECNYRGRESHPVWSAEQMRDYALAYGEKCRQSMIEEVEKLNTPEQAPKVDEQIEFEAFTRWANETWINATTHLTAAWQAWMARASLRRSTASPAR